MIFQIYFFSNAHNDIQWYTSISISHRVNETMFEHFVLNMTAINPILFAEKKNDYGKNKKKQLMNTQSILIKVNWVLLS